MLRKFPKAIFFTTALLYTVALLTVSVIKVEPAVEDVNFKNADKVFHFCAYFGLTVLWQVNLYKQKPRAYFSPSLKILLGVIFFGIIIEIIQGRLTTYRGFEYLDIVANSSGAVLAYIVILFLKPFNKLNL